MIKVYVAMPINANNACDVIKNIHRGTEYVDEIRQLGCAVYNPADACLTGIIIGNYEYSDYYDNGIEWLKVSDVVFFIPGYRRSKGCMNEHEIAESLGKPMFYTIEDLTKFISERYGNY